MKVSVIIITYNEEKNITACLESVKWADEIIVIDSESSDRTLTIAEEFGCITETRPWQGYAKQKLYALSKAKNEWVLSIDADERVSGQLKNEIIDLNGTENDGFRILRENYFLGRKITTCGWDKDYQLRLFRKSKTTVSDRLVHEGFVVDGKISNLQNRIIHHTHTDLKSTFEKINIYSSLQAIEQSKKKSPSITGIILHTLSAFFRYYFSLKGFKDGMYGFMVSVINAVTTLQTYMKIWEIKNVKSGELNK